MQLYMRYLYECKKIGKNASQNAKKHETKYKKILTNFENFKSLKNLVEKITQPKLVVIIANGKNQ